jgi:2-oxoglutarate dehydrogenase E2 component (dihydrolipoamide succinyltransferase)
MASDVLMPQMGESITEGTIVRWIKQVGDSVDRDEPLFEISTDKVDAEIPSPAAGVLTEIRAREGETVPVDSVVAVIMPAGSQPMPSQPIPSSQPAQGQVSAPGSGPSSPDASGDSTAPPPVAHAARPASAPVPAHPTSPSSQAAAHVASSVVQAAPAVGHAAASASESERTFLSDATEVPATRGGGERQRSSPLVRRIAQEHHVDVSRVPGTGIAGRVTKRDILSFIASPRSGAGSRSGDPASRRPAHAPGSGQTPATGEGLTGQTVPLSVIRRKISEHMLLSKRTSAHVHTVFEVNYTRIDQIRKARKAEYEAKGGRLTYLSFIVKAVADALRAVPIVNSSMDAENNVTYHRQVNVGIAVSLDWGLIVPVIKQADEKDLLGLSRSIADLADRARAKQLKTDDVAGGTFTVTNPGGIGAQFGLPIINQPQVGILGVGTIEKRAVVIDDAIGIRLMGYLALGFDHRVVDGAVGDHFMARIKHQLEHWDPSRA